MEKVFLEESMQGLEKRNKGKNVRLLAKLFLQAHRNKADNSMLFRNAAEDLMEKKNP